MAWMQVVGSLIGQMMAQGQYDKIAQIRAEAMERFGNTSLSGLEEIAKEKLGPSKLGGVSMDPRYKTAGDSALDKLMGIANADGLDAQSVAKLNESKNAAFGVDRGLRGASDASLARRGMLNTGAAVTSAQGAAQAGSDRSFQGSIAAAGDASKRALEALMAGGTMATRMGENDLAQKNAVAGSDDRIAEFNLRNKSDAQRALLDARLRIAAGMNQVGAQQTGDAQQQADRTVGMARGVGQAAGTQFGYLMGTDETIDPVTGRPKPKGG